MSAFECVCVSGKTAKLISFFSLFRPFLKLAKYETLHLYFRGVLTLGFRVCIYKLCLREHGCVSVFASSQYHLKKPTNPCVSAIKSQPVGSGDMDIFYLLQCQFK